MNCVKRFGRSVACGLLVPWIFTFGAHAADFVGAGVGAIPDNSPTGLTITFSVSGIVQPINKVRLRLGLAHTFMSDLEATLTSPNGVAHLLVFGRAGRNPASFFGYPADLNGTYTFDDTGSDLWASAAPLSSTGILASGRYATSTGGTNLSNHGGCSTSLSGAFDGLSGVNVNGTWTLKIADLVSSDTGSISSAVLSVLDDQIFTDSYDRTRGTCKLAQFDFTGTGRSSYLVVRNTGGGSTGAITWFVQNNDGTTTGTQQNFILGIATDFFVPGDFDGDGIYDAAVWTAGAAGIAHYTVRRSSRPTDTPLIVVFGQTGDDAAHIGDYDGDGFDDFAVYRSGASAGNPSHTLVHLTRGGADRNLTTGENGAFPAGGVDYTGNGRADMAVQANAGGGVASFRIYDGTLGTIANSFNFGTPTDVIVVGNHSGNALYDITVIRGNAGNIVWTTYDMGTNTGQPAVTFGTSATDFALSGDYDGDGLDDYAVWRPSATPGASLFSIRPSATPGSPITVNFGQNGDYPVANQRTH